MSNGYLTQQALAEYQRSRQALEDAANLDASRDPAGAYGFDAELRDQINLERHRQGKPPLAMPSEQVSVDVDPLHKEREEMIQRRMRDYLACRTALFTKEANKVSNPVNKESPRKHSHYFKDVSALQEIDIYRVCQLFGVDDPSGATQHALKKLLLPGQRGAGKGREKDYQEAIDTLNRKLEMMREDAA